jgi:hypothetical protein
LIVVSASRLKRVDSLERGEKDIEPYVDFSIFRGIF